MNSDINKAAAKGMAKVMNAYAEGADIEVKQNDSNEWKDVVYPDYPLWDWVNYTYRVKKEDNQHNIEEHLDWLARAVEEMRDMISSMGNEINNLKESKNTLPSAPTSPWPYYPCSPWPSYPSSPSTFEPLVTYSTSSPYLTKPYGDKVYSTSKTHQHDSIH